MTRKEIRRENRRIFWEYEFLPLVGFCLAALMLMSLVVTLIVVMVKAVKGL